MDDERETRADAELLAAAAADPAIPAEEEAHAQAPSPASRARWRTASSTPATSPAP
jgi:hypothetical protein